MGDLRTLKTYFPNLEDAELIQSLSKAAEKIYLNNPNQLYAIASQIPDIIPIAINNFTFKLREST
jgi:hypothetical protein